MVLIFPSLSLTLAMGHFFISSSLCPLARPTPPVFLSSSNRSWRLFSSCRSHDSHMTHHMTHHMTVFKSYYMCAYNTHVKKESVKEFSLYRSHDQSHDSTKGRRERFTSGMKACSCLMRMPLSASTSLSFFVASLYLQTTHTQFKLWTLHVCTYNV